jgi:hypothetical protein
MSTKPDKASQLPLLRAETHFPVGLRNVGFESTDDAPFEFPGLFQKKGGNAI